MMGLIWLIQLVHYPSFKFIEKNEFCQFHKMHSIRITLIVGPVMAIELISGVLLLLKHISNFLLIINLLFLILIWLATAFVSVPIHSRLESAKTDSYIDNLVKTNWIRTFLWTFRWLILVFQLSSYAILN